jgi:hypothetical protein
VSRTRRLLSVVLPLLVVAPPLLLTPRYAFAQKAGDSKSKARDLFKAGAKAIEQGKHAEGLPMVEEAEALFHAPTHLLWIARGKVGMNQLLDARDTYKKLIDEQLPASASDAFKEAQATASTELSTLDKRIPKLIVRPRPENAAGLEVKMNGDALAPDRLGVPFDVAPGSFTFQARANGLEASNVTVDAVERSTTEVRLVLHPFGQKGSEDSGASVVKVKQEDWPPMKIAGVALMAGGGAALAAGGALGALYFVRTSEADDKFDECGASCRPEVESLDADAALFGNLAIGLLAGGGAVLGTGIVLFAVAPSDSDAAPPAVTFNVTPGFVSLSGRF